MGLLTPEGVNTAEAIKELQSPTDDLKESTNKSNMHMILLTRILVILTILLSLPIMGLLPNYFSKTVFQPK